MPGCPSQPVYSVKCPLARVAKGPPCLVAGCGHIAGLRRRVCVCCLRRLGGETSSRYMLRLKLGAYVDFLRFEDECIERLRRVA